MPTVNIKFQKALFCQYESADRFINHMKSIQAIRNGNANICQTSMILLLTIHKVQYHYNHYLPRSKERKKNENQSANTPVTYLSNTIIKSEKKTMKRSLNVEVL